MRIGRAKFGAAAEQAGVDGVLVTDLPVEEAEDHIHAMRRHDLATIFLAAPTSTDARLKRIAKASTGFVYAVSRTGVTGARQQLTDDARTLVRRLRKHTKLPIAVGFGIAPPRRLPRSASLRRRPWSAAPSSRPLNAIPAKKPRLWHNLYRAWSLVVSPWWLASSR